MSLFRKIWSLFNASERKKVTLLFFLMIFMSFFEILGLGSIMPFLTVLGDPEAIVTNKYLKATYEYLEFKDKNSFLIFLGVSALIILVIGSVLKSITSYSKYRFSSLRNHSFGQRILENYLNKPYSYFLNRNSSEMIKIILSEVEIVISQGLTPALNILTQTILSITIVCFLIVLDPILALILFVIFVGFYLIMYLTLQKYIQRIGKKRINANTKRFKIVSETLGGIKDIKIFGLERVYLKIFNKPSYEFSHYNSINSTLAELPQFLVEVIAFGSILTMSIFAIISEDISIGKLLPILDLYALGALKLKPSVSAIYKSLTTMKFGASAVDNVIKDLKIINKEKTNVNDNKKLNFKKQLILKDIFFTYPNANEVILKQVDLEVKANTTVGVVGQTGAGKSTLVDIILGLLTPDSGQITLDGNQLNKKNLRHWQNNIGYVPQSIFLLDDTIINNIAFGIEESKVNVEQVKRVAKMAQVHEFVSKLEFGYSTIIGERGVRLSGGQRQRIGIARALYNNPELLVLDEATSSLDTKTELDIMKAIDGLSGKKTIIMIAHRLSTIEKCDKIITVENGKIL